MLGQPRRTEHGRWVLAEAEGSVVLLEGDPLPDLLQSGAVTGRADGAPGEIAGRRFAATVTVASFHPDPTALESVALAIRDHIDGELEPYDPGRGLLAGFLIGDTSQIDPVDAEAMRRSGLAHFVAVSGSNVALFLFLVFVAVGPLALGPRRRAVVGLAVVPVYAAVTGFEPSVLRASTMAAITLAGRLSGIVLEAWQLLALAIGGLLIVDPGLATSAGFQLSVAATAGVLAGARWPVEGRVRRALAVTMGAQLAVAPLLLGYFGSVPLFSPLLNLVAAPLVAASTALGAIGVAGIPPLVDLGALTASAVLKVASLGSGMPQLDAGGLATALLAAGVVSKWRILMAPAAVAGGLFAAVAMIGPGGAPPPGSVVVLDVGHGDAILLHGGDGRFALVDGGPDQTTLLNALRRYGVRSLEFVVLSHVHADHATGLIDLNDRVPIGAVLSKTHPHQSSASTDLVSGLDDVPLIEAGVGDTLDLGSLAIEVVAPTRRYASPNDQSVVLRVEGGSGSMLLAGDIEVVAQRELGHLRADVLKVPHQGAATSDSEWLVSVGADAAVISVGPNQFGHPAQWVIDILEESGAEVLRTDRDGDVVVDLSQSTYPSGAARRSRVDVSKGG